jgi:hypothetical protein
MSSLVFVVETEPPRGNLRTREMMEWQSDPNSSIKRSS